VAPAAGATPPARVGRLSAITGTVSFHPAAGTGWQAATLNYPVAAGDAVFAEQGSHAEIEVGNDLAALDGGTELDMATLDEQHLVLSEPQGRLFLVLGPQALDAINSVATPRGLIQLSGQGVVEIVAGDTATPTTVAVVQGATQITATGLQLQVAAGQTATITGTDTLSGHVVASGPPDPFLSAMLAASQQNGTLPPEVANMTGCRALAHVGTWRTSAHYGQVWYPPVQAGWVPYREGHWAYVQPWGWTWVDNESWGFAPFHYGRWIEEDGQWGWIPGEEGAPEAYYAEPVYAPALVSWGDVGEAALAGAAIGALAAGAIGWIPLGPNEPYYPPYRVDRGYFERINRGDVRDIRNVSMTDVRISNFGGFANRGGATMASGDAFRSGQPMGRAAHGFTPAAFQARPFPAGRGPGGPAPGYHAEPARGPDINPAVFHPQHLEGGRLPFRGGSGQGPGTAAAFRPEMPGLRSHDQVLTGRPGAPPAFGPHEGEGGHAGLIAGAAVGAVGAGLAAHALINRGAPGGREAAPRSSFAPHIAPVGRPMSTPTGPREGAHQGTFRPQASRAEAPRSEAFHQPVRPEASRPQARPMEQARPAAPRFQAPRAEGPRFQAPRSQGPGAMPHAQAPHFAPRPGPAPGPRPGPRPEERRPH
jgi:hypothetical protein